MTMTKTTIPNENMEQNSRMKQKRATLAMSALVLALAATSMGNVDAFSVDSGRFTRPNAATSIVGNTKVVQISNAHSRKRNLVRLYEKQDENDTQPARSNPLQNLLVAAAFVTATLDPTNAIATDSDLNLVSPGTPTIYTKTNSGDLSKVIESTESTLNKVVDAAVLNGSNRKELTESVKRIQSTVSTELTSVQAWKEVTQILKDYGVDLQKEASVVVRPPSDWKRTFEDATNSKVNILVNGEIVQIELEHVKNTNTKKQLEAGEPIQPDDEWVLRVKGYKGFDPTAPIKIDKPTYNRQRPEWFRKANSYWNAPLQSSNAVVKTQGDVIVLGGAATITLSYALSYAYYVDQIEKEAAAAKEKQAAVAAKKKKAAAAKKKAASKEETPKKGWLGGKKKAEPEKPKAKTKAAPKKKVDAPKKETTKAVETKKETPEKKKEKPEEEKTKVVEPKKETVEKKTETKEPTKTETKKEAPKPVEAAKPPAPAPAPTPKPEKVDPPKIEEEEDNVKVVIDFDKDGKVVIKVDDDDATTKRGGILDFAQALYLPWLGWFVSSSPTLDDRNTVMRFAQALLCPWAGIFFPKDWSTTPVQFDKDDDDDDK